MKEDETEKKIQELLEIITQFCKIVLHRALLLLKCVVLNGLMETAVLSLHWTSRALANTKDCLLSVLRVGVHSCHVVVIY